MKIMTALTINIPTAADRVYKLGEDLLVYSEKRKEMDWSYDCSRCNKKNDYNPIP